MKQRLLTFCALAVILAVVAVLDISLHTPAFSGVLIAIILLGCAGELRRLFPGSGLVAARNTFLAGMYVAVAGGALYAIRLQDHGILLALYAVGTAKMTDNGGLFVGRLIGKRPLCPAISPAKTVAGFWGGLAFGTAFAAGTAPWLAAGRLDLAQACGFGIVVSLFATLGDLVESALKRAAGVKDSGAVFPGMGGFLDLMDSVLLSAPAAWLLLQV